MAIVNIIQGIECPCCGRRIPIDISFDGLIQDYINYRGTGESYDNGYPEISLCLMLDLDQLQKDLKKLKEGRARYKKFEQDGLDELHEMMANRKK